MSGVLTDLVTSALLHPFVDIQEWGWCGGCNLQVASQNLL